MGVYIKSLEIPIDNTVLIRVFPASENGEFYVQQLDVDGDILDELWAVPVPPRGRLIDADALIRVLERCAEDDWNKKTSPFSWAYAYECETDVVRDMPTIIPAEEGE